MKLLGQTAGKNACAKIIQHALRLMELAHVLKGGLALIVVLNVIMDFLVKTAIKHAIAQSMANAIVLLENVNVLENIKEKLVKKVKNFVLCFNRQKVDDGFYFKKSLSHNLPFILFFLS